MLPLVAYLQWGEGWWSSQYVVWAWTVAIAALLISRIPTLSLKTIRVPAKAADASAFAGDEASRGTSLRP